jgi:hypothetical protein
MMPSKMIGEIGRTGIHLLSADAALSGGQIILRAACLVTAQANAQENLSAARLEQVGKGASGLKRISPE